MLILPTRRRRRSADLLRIFNDQHRHFSLLRLQSESELFLERTLPEGKGICVLIWSQIDGDIDGPFDSGLIYHRCV